MIEFTNTENLPKTTQISNYLDYKDNIENVVDNEQCQNIDDKTKHDKLTAQKYISISDIVYYAEKGLSLRDIGFQVGCSAQNVQKRLENIGYSRGLIGRYRDNKKDLIELAEAKLAQSVVSRDIDKASLRDTVDALSKIHNIGRLESGKSTHNVSIHTDIAALKALENGNNDNKRDEAA